MPPNPLGDFLRARRELTHPTEHGLPASDRRRVPGLRREEVAMLAGISAEYYVRLERGRDRNPSEQVLDALARVLGLDAESRIHLGSLVGPAPRQRRPRAGAARVAPAVLRLLAAAGDVPAFVLNRYLDVLAANQAALDLHGGSLGGNVLRQLFLEPTGRALYPDWDEVAAEAVATLRGTAVGRDEDPRLTALVGELSVRSAEFRRLWARHDIRTKSSGVKRIASPTAGPVTVHWEGLAVLSADQLLITYLVESSNLTTSPAQPQEIVTPAPPCP